MYMAIIHYCLPNLNTQKKQCVTLCYYKNLHLAHSPDALVSSQSIKESSLNIPANIKTTVIIYH